MKNEVTLDFRICDFEDITASQITNILNIQPTKIYIKGQKRNPENINSKSVLKSNIWIMGSSLSGESSFEDQMNSLLDVIESKLDLFKPLCNKYYCEFSCALFIRYDNDESTPWIHLGDRYNKLIKELNIEFDVDIYCLPNPKDE